MSKIKILLEKDEAKQLNKKIKDYNNSKTKKSPDLYSILKIEKNYVDSVEKYFKKPSKDVNIESCFFVFKLSQFFKVKFSSEEFFHIESYSINDIITSLAILLQCIQTEANDELFDNFLESGNLIEILSQNIDECFKCKYFNNLNNSIVIKIIEKGKESGKFVPSDSLYKFISAYIPERFVLLRFLNFNYLRSVKTVPILEFKQYVIQLINQYDECLSNILGLDLDKQIKKEQTDCFRNLYQKGNQIAAFYLNSNKSNKKNVKSNSSARTNRTKQTETNRWDNYSKTTKENIRKSNRLNLVTFDDSYDDDDIDPPQKVKNNQTKNQNLPNSSSTKRKSEISNPNLPSSRSKLTKKGQTEQEYEEDEYEVDLLPSSKTKLKSISKKTPTPAEKPFKTGHYYRPLTAEDKERAKIWKETDQIIKKGIYQDDINHTKYDIREDVKYCNENTKIIRPSHKFKTFDDNQNLTQKEKRKILEKVRVVNMSTFGAAKKYNKNDKNDVCVLNFASATQPGGGVINGRGAQEETLSRMSSLYSSLTINNEMYKFNEQKNDPFYSDYMIFSPDVVVFRDDDYNLIKFYHVSVISSAAVNCQEVKQVYGDSKRIEGKIYETMKNRCRKILLLCIENDIPIIVLGAFGCGVFKNKPEDVSNIFRELIVEEGYGSMFERIIFAIKSPPNSPNYTLKQFKKAFDIDN